MANVFASLPATAGDGSGADVVTSGMGRYKNVTVQGSFTGTILVEASLDGGASWFAVTAFTAPGTQPVQVAAQRMRATRAGVVGGGTPTIDVASHDTGGLFATLAIPAGAGAGAPTDISKFGTFSTIQIAGTLGAGEVVIVETSDDGGVSWSEIAAFAAPGLKNVCLVAQQVRVVRAGVVTGAPVAAFGAVNDTSAVVQSRTYPEIRLAAIGDGARPTIVHAGATLGYVMAVGDEVFVEFPLEPMIDRSADISVFVSWAPSGSQADRLVSWQLNSLPLTSGLQIASAGNAHVVADEAVPATAGIYEASGFTIPAAEITDDTFEFHCRISRIASSNDPAADPGIHHVSVIQTLLP